MNAWYTIQRPHFGRKNESSDDMPAGWLDEKFRFFSTFKGNTTKQIAIGTHQPSGWVPIACKVRCYSPRLKASVGSATCENCYLLLVNGSTYSLSVTWSATCFSLSWFWMYSAIFLVFFPAVPSQYPGHQNARFPYLHFKFACRSKMIKLLFSLRNPTKQDSLIF